MKRVTFDPAADPKQAADQPPRGNLCAAHGCRLAGACSAHSGATQWWCGYHFAALPDEIPLITESLRKHSALVNVINGGQTLLKECPTRGDLHAAFWSQNRLVLDQCGYFVGEARNAVWDDLSAWLYRVRTLLGRLVREESGVDRQQRNRAQQRIWTDGEPA
jgi:hypothetical protein